MPLVRTSEGRLGTFGSTRPRNGSCRKSTDLPGPGLRSQASCPSVPPIRGPKGLGPCDLPVGFLHQRRMTWTKRGHLRALKFRDRATLQIQKWTESHARGRVYVGELLPGCDGPSRGADSSGPSSQSSDGGPCHAWPLGAQGARSAPRARHLALAESTVGREPGDWIRETTSSGSNGFSMQAESPGHDALWVIDLPERTAQEATIDSMWANRPTPTIVCAVARHANEPYATGGR